MRHTNSFRFGLVLVLIAALGGCSGPCEKLDSITGPTLNANGELCGLLFDGTYESLGSDYLFEPVTRSIHVDSTYMLWVMDAVDHAHALLQEMGVTPKF